MIPVVAAHLVQFAVAAASWDCAAGSDITTFPDCDAFLQSNDDCATVLDRPGKEDCYCHQDYLDSLYGCENELRLCFRGNRLDTSFESALQLWESLCRTVMTFSPTTAEPSSFEPYPEQLCLEVKKACATYKTLLQDCLPYASDKDTSRLSSCTCRPTMLREEYSCRYLVNATCLGREATLSNLFGYSGCDNFEAVIGTGLPVDSPATQTELPTLLISTAMEGSRTESTAPATSTSDNASETNHPRLAAALMFTLCCLAWTLLI